MSVDALVTALDGLQSDAGRRYEYNTWLQDFQRSSDAWNVVNDVLENPEYSRALKIFCAQTLRNKVAYDLHQVPRDARLRLKDQVLVLLERNAQLLSVVGVQLCIALAAFAMQVAEWEQPIEELMTRFDSREMVPLLFEFLKVLPEEFSAARVSLVDPELRLHRSTTLVQHSAPLVLNFMLSRAEVMVESSSTQTLFFEAIKPWLSEVELAELIESPFLNWMFDSLSVDDSRSAAVDCLIVILDETNDVHEPIVQEAIKVLYPKLLALPPVYAPQYEDDEELHSDFTRLFSEAAANWHTLISRDPQNFMPLLQALAQCLMASHMDLEVVEYTFTFFDKIRTMLGEPLPGAPTPRNQLPREPFVPVFLQLFAAFTRLLEFPDSFNGNLEEEETFRDFRYDIGDLLKICSSIAGHQKALEWCYTTLYRTAEEGSQRWQPVEAVLFSIRAIARTVPMSENVWMPKIYDLFAHLPCATEEAVQHAALMVLGRYSQWTAGHPQYLGFELKYIIDSVYSPFAEVRRAAAHAFLYLSTDGASGMVKFLPQLIEFFNGLSGKADLEAMCKYSDGLGAIIDQVPLDKMTPMLDAVFEPIMSRAHELLAAGSSPEGSSVVVDTENESSKRVAIDIQALGSLIAMVNSAESDAATHPLIGEIKKHHALLTQMIAQFGPKNSMLLESISRYYVHAVFNAGVILSDEMYVLLQAVASVAAVRPMSPVLFEFSSAIIQNFNDRQDFGEGVDPSGLLADVWTYCQSMANALFTEKAVELLKEEGGIVEQRTVISDVIHHGFHFLCDLVIYYPVPFFSQMFDAAVQLSIHVLNLSWDSEALKAVSHMYDDVASYVADTAPLAPHEAQIPEHIRSSIEKHGYQIVHALFYWFLLKADPSFELMAEHLVDFAFRMAPVTSIVWLQQVLATLPAGTVSDEETMQFAQRVFQNMSSRRFRGIGREMKLFVAAYAERNITPR